MTITAINTVRAEMLLHGLDASTLAARLSASGDAVTGDEIAAMIRRRRMPALLFLRILQTLCGSIARIPDDLSELT
jgi:hypothetical protein